jgi:Tfp pilus assembly protein PilF
MRYSIGLLAVITAGALAGCVTTDGSGGKPLKQDDPQEAAAKYNIQLGTAYLKQGNYALAREKLERSLKQNPKDPTCIPARGCCTTARGIQASPTSTFAKLRLAPENP